jgi:hypothetical protein
MKLLRTISFFLFLFLICKITSAQVFGGNPSSLKWDQINTDTVRVIFPRGLSAEGERVANLVQYLSKNDRKTIGYREWKLNLVLQNQTMNSNGYVALAPFRSEFQITPPQQSFQLGSDRWIDFLSVHEYRHALQNMNFDKGLSHVMGILFGEAGQSFATDLAVPNWFWEGDAVFMETSLTDQGRGRLPAFFDEFRALQLEHKNYSWLKMRNGSYKDEVPDHYPLGYLMCAYGREIYGDTIWKNVTNEAVRFKGLIYPFSHALKKYTGYRVIPFYHQMLDYYTKKWAADTPTHKSYIVTNLTTARHDVFSDQEYPAFISNDSLLFLQTTYKKIPAIILMDSLGNISTVVKQDIVLDNYFSYNDHKIVWIGYRFDPRWGWKDFGDIRLYDMQTHKTYTLSHRTKYFSPDISHDGKKIIAFRTTANQQYELVLINAETGKVLEQLPNPDHYYYTYPKFSIDNQSIFTTVKNREGNMALIQQWLYTDSVKIWTPFAPKALGIPMVTPGHVYFTAGFGRQNNIYVVNTSSGDIQQVTNETYGNYQPAVNPAGNKLVFSEFSLYGNQLKSIHLDTSAFQPVTTSAIMQVHDFYVRKAITDEGHDILNSIPNVHYPITKYPQGSHLINAHSWEPIINDPDYGFELLSDNILNTLSASMYYQYNRDEYSHTVGINATYSGWYPVLNVGGNYAFDRSELTSRGNLIYWNESSESALAYVPWNFSSGKYFRYLTAGGGLHHADIYYLPNVHYILHNFGFNYTDESIQFLQERVAAQQNIYSHFAQNIYLQWDHSLGNMFASQWLLQGDFYLPGFFPNHSIELQVAYQQKDTANAYSFTDDFIYARGYTTPYYASIYKLGANYNFPILYPDWGIGGIVYALRIRGNVFYDYSRTTYYNAGQAAHQQFRSAGMELYFDTNWWNEYPISVGIRFSHLFDTDPQDPLKRNTWEVIIPLQLN